MADFALQFENIRKEFDDGTTKRLVVNNVSFSVREGEFFAILGPSGCGKTTLLRMISGLEEPSQGRVLIAGQLVNNIHPHKRNVHMVFQKYALFPHLNVFDNVAFGLRMKGLPTQQIKERVERMLNMVKLSPYADRPTHTLSGGEQQRVALVRALVNEPKILLLDEPLGALDQKLREEMQIELTSIQKTLKTTFIFVTHDQSEALTLADRVAIMNKGNIEQIGTPNEVYENPTTPFVARFVGTGNMLKGQLSNDGGASKLECLHYGPILYRSENTPQGSMQAPGAYQVLVRPEKIRIYSNKPDQSKNSLNIFKGTIIERVYFGATTQIKLQLNEHTPPLIALVANQTAQKMPQLKLGEKYFAAWDASDSILIPESTLT